MPNHASGQPLSEWLRWDCCDQVHEDGTACTGAAQSDYGRCLAHLEKTQLDELMARRPDEPPPNLDARGTWLTMDDLKRVLTAARRNSPGLHLGDVNLDGAKVDGHVVLQSATAEGCVSIKGCVSLKGAEVKGNVGLRANVDKDVSFWQAKVQGHVALRQATVKGDVSLRETNIEGRVEIAETMIKGNLCLDHAAIRGEGILGPMSVQKLSLTGVEFTRRVRLDVIAERIVLSNARFLGGLTARVGGAWVLMDGVEVQGPAVVGRVGSSSWFEGCPAPAPPRPLKRRY